MFYRIYTGNGLERRLKFIEKVRHRSKKPKVVAEWYRRKKKIGKAIKVVAVPIDENN